MSKATDAWRRNSGYIYTQAKKSWDKVRESEGGIAGISAVLGSIFPPLAGLGQYFKKETSPGSGVYESNLINPVSVTIAGVGALLVYTIIKKKK